MVHSADKHIILKRLVVVCKTAALWQGACCQTHWVIQIFQVYMHEKVKFSCTQNHTVLGGVPIHISL